jgi:hypothetical protein
MSWKSRDNARARPRVRFDDNRNSSYEHSSESITSPLLTSRGEGGSASEAVDLLEAEEALRAIEADDEDCDDYGDEFEFEEEGAGEERKAGEENEWDSSSPLITVSIVLCFSFC